MKEVLVLGGGGFIGRNIVEFLVDRGDCKVTAADIRAGSNWARLSKNPTTAGRFNAVLEDFSNLSAFERLEKIGRKYYERFAS